MDKMQRDFRKISIDDKELFDRFLANYPPEISEMTFTNFFVLRNTRPIEFAVFDNHLIISFIDHDKKQKFFCPVGNTPELAIKSLLEAYPETFFERVGKKIGEKTAGLKIEEDRDNYDYVYRISDLIELPGQDFAPKRNFIYSFEKNNPKVEIIDDKLIHECLSLEEEWCNLRNCKDDKTLSAEYTAIYSALKNYKALNLFGIAILIDDKVQGFAIGEKLNATTFVEHFEKANPAFRGAYQFVLHEFAKNIPKEFTFLNREQDLGIEGLRKAKLSYHPSNMVEKVRISKH